MMRWKGLELWAKGNSVKVWYSIDGGTTWAMANTVPLTSDYPADSAPQKVFFDVVSSRIRIRFSNATSGETFTLKKYQMLASLREVRK